jgi:tRNA nucleotidyltransferase (CCA-adding enzyme)
MPEIMPMKGFLQHNPHHIHDVLAHTAVVLKNTPPQKSLRFAALFHDIGKPKAFTMDEAGVGHFYGHQKISCEIAKEILGRLKADAKTTKEVEMLVLWHDIDIEPTARVIRRRLHQFGEPMFRNLMAIKRADTLGQSESSLYRLEEQTRIHDILDKILDEKECFTLRDLRLNGSDVIRLGVPRGPEVGRVLSSVLHAVMDGHVVNEEDNLLEYARQVIRDVNALQ